ncbi:ATP-dependent zinc protease [Billgrantia azerbaijanica]|nr:ATP-dependent zinc protease [Halomonas azerbaijanica]
MRPTPLIATWLLVSLLSGCAFVPGTQSEPEPRLTPDDFNAGMAHLEQSLEARCDRLDARLESLDGRHVNLSDDIRDVGELVQRLRRDIGALPRRGEETVVVTNECREADGDPLDGKALVGRAEWVGLSDIGTYLRARIDSGANTSSLSAREVTRFERDGEDWVRFKLGLSDEDVAVDAVREEWIEAPVARQVRVSQADGQDSRPVVSLLMTLGPIQQSVEFILADRTHPDYPVLLGRRFLMDLALIDVAESYLHPRPEFPSGRPAEDEGDEPGGEEG